MRGTRRAQVTISKHIMHGACNLKSSVQGCGRRLACVAGGIVGGIVGCGAPHMSSKRRSREFQSPPPRFSRGFAARDQSLLLILLAASLAFCGSAAKILLIIQARRWLDQSEFGWFVSPANGKGKPLLAGNLSRNSDWQSSLIQISRGHFFPRLTKRRKRDCS